MTYLKRFDNRGRAIWGGVLAVVLWLNAGRAQTNRLIFQETFESYKNVKALRTAWSGGNAQLITNAPGGGQCAAHNGTGVNRRGGFFVFPDATHHLVLTADLYDFGTNTDQNVTVSINGDDPHDNIAIGMKGPFCYVARVSGFSSKTNWIPFKRRQMPVVGWNRFRAVVSATNLVATMDFGIDGKIDRTLTIPFNRPAPTFTQLRFGGYSGKLAERGMVLVDNIKLELVTLEFPAVVSKAEVLQSPATPSYSNGTSGPVIAELAPDLTAFSAQGPLVTNAPSLTEQSNSANAAAPVVTIKSAVSSQSGAPLIAARQRDDAIPIAGWWIGGALVVIIGLLGVVILLIGRQTKAIPRALLSSGGKDAGGLALVQSNDHWRERALHAEAIAAQQAQILKDKVGPELVQFAKESLVQGLYSQRTALLDTQTKAQQTLVELENRLSELHLPAKERILAYEKRIAELEKQLECRGDEMRELTRATLSLVQEKLEEERRHDGHFN